MKTFEPLNVSSKFAICGLPIRVDTYKTCGFQCEYCFANSRKIMEFAKELQIADLKSVERRLCKVLTKKEVDETNFLNVLISKGYTWHLGGMSDPFQPVEEKLQVTKKLLDITNQYSTHILMSTKSDTVYGADIDPKLHTFQLSVTNTKDRKDIEPNVPSIESRYRFYKSLKERGFKVGIRIQPFIPNITDESIVDMFHDADNISIEGLKLVPQNEAHKKRMLELTGLSLNDFTQMGLLNLKAGIRWRFYQPILEKIKAYNIPYSLADNDFHHIGTNKCCCGDRLVEKSTSFNTTAMIYQYGINYTKEQLEHEIAKCGVGCCKCEQLFTSNRTHGLKTVSENFEYRIWDSASPFSPKFLDLETERKPVEWSNLDTTEQLTMI